MLKIGAKQEMKGEADWSKPRNELRPVKKNTCGVNRVGAS